MRLALVLSVLLLFATLGSVFALACPTAHWASSFPDSIPITAGLADAQRGACLVSAVALAISIWRLRRKEEAIRAVVTNIVGMKRITPIAFFASALFAACQAQARPPVVVTNQLGAHPLTVIGHGTNCGRELHFTGDQTLWFTGIEIWLLKGKLIVNDKVYATLGDGDAILVSNKVVSVNGVAASPRPMTAEEDLEKYPLLTERLVMAGHPVLIACQHRSGISRRILSRTERLEVDGISIAVTPRTLVVNGRKRVVLKDGEGIEVDRGRVAVSGNRVWPEK